MKKLLTLLSKHHNMLSVKGLAQRVLEINKRGGDTQALSDFLAYVESRGAAPLLPHVVHYLERVVEQESLSQRLVVRTSHDVSQATIAAIREYIGADKEVNASITTDPDLIGGFVAEYKFKRHDMTLKNRLRKLKSSLV